MRRAILRLENRQERRRELRRRIAAREQCGNEARKAREHAPIGVAESAATPNTPKDGIETKAATPTANAPGVVGAAPGFRRTSNMRADVEAAAADIERSVDLLRRRL